MAGSEPVIGSIELWPGNFAPMGWAFCDGRILNISEYDLLYSLIGITYGGNGQTTFALPDLRGRVPIGYGQGTGLPNYTLGLNGGVETVNLQLNQLPSHNHLILCDNSTNNLQNSPTAHVPAKSSTASKNYAASSAEDKAMAGNMANSAGGNQPHDNIQPFLAMNFIIALEGLYPQQP